MIRKIQISLKEEPLIFNLFKKELNPMIYKK